MEAETEDLTLGGASEREPGAIRGLPIRGLCLPAAIGLCLALAPAAAAAESSFTWAGGGSADPGKWSVGANWGAASAPTSEEELATLTFPELSGCTAPKACYSSDNDLKRTVSRIAADRRWR